MRLDSCGLEDQLGAETEQQTREDHPGDENRVARALHNLHELKDDVENRTGREGEKEDRERLARPRLAEDRAEKGGPSADDPEEREELPARALTRHGSDDAEPLGRVVQAEADDQQEREADLTGGARLTDGQALGKVVQTDPGRDEEGEPLAGR